MRMRDIIRLVEDCRDIQLNILRDEKRRKATKPLDAVSVTSTEEFRKWFGKSKIRDRKGNPIPMFHGTPHDFTSFDMSRSASYRPNMMFFTTDPEIAASYSGQYTSISGSRVWKDGAKVMPVYLRVLKPLKVNAYHSYWNQIPFDGDDWSTNELAVYARENGYDGLVVKDVYDTGEGLTRASTVVVVFSPNQVKSVFNQGTWDPESSHVSEDDSTIDH